MTEPEPCAENERMDKPTRRIITEDEHSYIVECSCGWAEVYDSPEAAETLWQRHVEADHSDGDEGEA